MNGMGTSYFPYSNTVHNNQINSNYKNNKSEGNSIER
jgi:hypothetical protein